MYYTVTKMGPNGEEAGEGTFFEQKEVHSSEFSQPKENHPNTHTHLGFLNMS